MNFYGIVSFYMPYFGISKRFNRIPECQNALSEFWNVKMLYLNSGMSKRFIWILECQNSLSQSKSDRSEWARSMLFWEIDGIVIGKTNEFRGWYRSRFSCLCVWQWQDRDLSDIDRHLRWLRQFLGFPPYQKVSIYGSWSGLQDFYRMK